MSKGVWGARGAPWEQIRGNQPAEAPDDLAELIAHRQRPYPDPERRNWIERRVREWAQRPR